MPKTLYPKILSIFLAVTPVAAVAAVPVYSNLYVFGDSYCDVGNVSTATGGAIPGPLYYQGRFSNGPLWVDHLAGFLGLPMKPELLGGTNYAFAGAEVTTASNIGSATIPSVPQEVALYLSQHNGQADPNALYILEGGGNDILDATSGTPEELATGIAQGLALSELALRQAGAKHFVIPNLFNVALLPAAAGNTKFAALTTEAMNQDLDQALAADEALPGISILRMDIFSLVNSVYKDPTHFGFKETGPCLTTKVCADPDHTLFWDVHHPTEFFGDFFAVVIENVLTTSKP